MGTSGERGANAARMIAEQAHERSRTRSLNNTRLLHDQLEQPQGALREQGLMGYSSDRTEGGMDGLGSWDDWGSDDPADTGTTSILSHDTLKTVNDETVFASNLVRSWMGQPAVITNKSGAVVNSSVQAKQDQQKWLVGAGIGLGALFLLGAMRRR